MNHSATTNTFHVRPGHLAGASANPSTGLEHALSKSAIGRVGFCSLIPGYSLTMAVHFRI